MLVIQKFYGIYLKKKSSYYKAREVKQQKWLITFKDPIVRKLQAIVWLLFLIIIINESDKVDRSFWTGKLTYDLLCSQIIPLSFSLWYRVTPIVCFLLITFWLRRMWSTFLWSGESEGTGMEVWTSREKEFTQWVSVWFPLQSVNIWVLHIMKVLLLEHARILYVKFLCQLDSSFKNFVLLSKKEVKPEQTRWREWGSLFLWTTRYVFHCQEQDRRKLQGR